MNNRPRRTSTLFARPEHRDRFTTLFKDVLGCDVRELDFGLPYPILLVSFDDDSAFSAEFSELALTGNSGGSVDDTTAFRGAWLDFARPMFPSTNRSCARLASLTSDTWAATTSTSVLLVGRSFG